MKRHTNGEMRRDRETKRDREKGSESLVGTRGRVVGDVGASEGGLEGV